MLRRTMSSRANLKLAEIPEAAAGPDASGIAVMSGWLKKCSRKQRWQARRFRTVNNYLVYSTGEEIRSVFDLCKVSMIQVLDRWGRFELQFDIDAEPPLRLKAKSLTEAERWVENLTMRRHFYIEKSGRAQADQGGKLDTDLPLIIKQYKSTPDAEVRAQKFASRFESAFSDAVGAPLERQVNVMRTFLEELVDATESCRSYPEILLDLTTCACPLIGAKIQESTANTTEAHEALKLMDYISAFEALLMEVESSAEVQSYLADHADSEFSTVSMEREKLPSMLEELTKIYVVRAEADVLEIARKTARFVLDNPNKAIRTNQESGIVSSTGPPDIIRIAWRYLWRREKREIVCLSLAQANLMFS